MDYHVPGQADRVKVSILESPGKLSIARSELLRGTNRYSGKTWARWRTSQVAGIYTTSTGLLVPYHRVRNKNNWHNGYLNIFYSKLLYGAGRFTKSPKDILSAKIYEKFGISSVEDIYPMCRELNISAQEIPPGLRSAYRQNNIKDCVGVALGKGAIRKDIIRTLGQYTDENSNSKVHVGKGLYGAKFWSGLVPMDYLPGVMRHFFNREPIHRVSPASMRKTLKRLPENRRKALCNELISNPNSALYFNDVARMTNSILSDEDFGKTIIPKTWRELHDYGTMLKRVGVSQPINIPPKLMRLLSGEHDGLRFELATHTSQLHRWGKEFSHCIGSYDRAAVSGNHILGAVYEGDTMLYNFDIEVRGNKRRLTQCLGKFNKHPSPEHANTIEQFFAGKVDINNYWGRPAH